MGGYEKCSLVVLFIAYIVVILLIITYEVTECWMSQIKQILNIGNHSICRATTRPPHPSSTAECLRLIVRLREEQASAASWEPWPPFEAAEMD